MLTVEQVQELYAIARTVTDPTEQAIRNVMVIRGLTERQVDDMPVPEFNKYAREAVAILSYSGGTGHPHSFIKANGRLFQVNYKVHTISAGQNAEINEWLREGDVIGNLDKLLASISVEVKRYGWIKLPARKRREHAEIAADFKQADFFTVMDCIVFFCAIFEHSTKAILESPILQKEMTTEQINELQMVLSKFTGGFATLNGSQTTKILPWNRRRRCR